MAIQAGIWALGLGFGLWSWDLSINAGIWASMLGFRPQSWDLSWGAGVEEGEGEMIFNERSKEGAKEGTFGGTRRIFRCWIYPQDLGDDLFSGG